MSELKQAIKDRLEKFIQSEKKYYYVDHVSFNADEVKALLKELNKSQWISIDDGLPEEYVYLNCLEDFNQQDRKSVV